jgi:hypothetical protein
MSLKVSSWAEGAVSLVFPILDELYAAIERERLEKPLRRLQVDYSSEIVVESVLQTLYGKVESSP